MININGYQFHAGRGEKNIRAIAEAYKSGAPRDEICAEFKCSPGLVLRVSDAFGLEKRPHGGTGRAGTRVGDFYFTARMEEKLDAIANDMRAGMDMAGVIKRHRISKWTYARALKLFQVGVI